MALSGKTKTYVVGALGILVLLLIGSVWFRGFEQRIVKSWGGSMTIDLNKDEKLTNVTWKDDQLWILVRKNDGTSEFREYSKYGVLQGKVYIREK